MTPTKGDEQEEAGVMPAPAPPPAAPPQLGPDVLTCVAVAVPTPDLLLPFLLTKPVAERWRQGAAWRWAARHKPGHLRVLAAAGDERAVGTMLTEGLRLPPAAEAGAPVRTAAAAAHKHDQFTAANGAVGADTAAARDQAAASSSAAAPAPAVPPAGGGTSSSTRASSAKERQALLDAALVEAAGRGHLGVAAQLLMHGADATAPAPALARACAGCVRPEASALAGKAALEVASTRCDLPLLMLLLEACSWGLDPRPNGAGGRGLWHLPRTAWARLMLRATPSRLLTSGTYTTFEDETNVVVMWACGTSSAKQLRAQELLLSLQRLPLQTPTPTPEAGRSEGVGGVGGGGNSAGDVTPGGPGGRGLGAEGRERLSRLTATLLKRVAGSTTAKTATCASALDQLAALLAFCTGGVLPSMEGVLAEALPQLLAAAARANHGDAIAMLLDQGADPATNESEALRGAAGVGAVEAITQLAAAGADVDALAGEPLYQAAYNGHEGATGALLTAGANPLADSCAALVEAVAVRSVGCCRLLVEAGAAMAAVEDGEALKEMMMLALGRGGGVPLVASLLGAGVALPAKALALAARHRAGAAVLRVLIDAGAPVAATCKLPSCRRDKRGPLYYALSGRAAPDWAAAEALVAAGADVREADDYALWRAVEAGQHQLVALLLQAGASPDSACARPLVLAASRGDLRLLAALLSAPACGPRLHKVAAALLAVQECAAGMPESAWDAAVAPLRSCLAEAAAGVRDCLPKYRAAAQAAAGGSAAAAAEGEPRSSSGRSSGGCAAHDKEEREWVTDSGSEGGWVTDNGSDSDTAPEPAAPQQAPPPQQEEGRHEAAAAAATGKAAAADAPPASPAGAGACSSAAPVAASPPAEQPAACCEARVQACLRAMVEALAAYAGEFLAELLCHPGVEFIGSMRRAVDELQAVLAAA